MNRRRTVFLGRASAVLLTSASCPAIATAQLPGQIRAPEQAVVDQNGVNVATGTYRMPHDTLTIGSGIGAISDVHIYGQQAWKDARVELNGTPGAPVVIGTGDRTYYFDRSGNGFRAAPDGATLTVSNGWTPTYTVTLIDGTKYVYDHVENTSVYDQSGRTRPEMAYLYLTSIIRPDGMKTQLEWTTAVYCTEGGETSGDYGGCKGDPYGGSGPQSWMTRLERIWNSAGSSVSYAYEFDMSIYRPEPTEEEITAWQTLRQAYTGDESMPSAAFRYELTWFVDGYATTDDVTDSMGRTTRYTKQYRSGAGYEGMRRPGSDVDNLRVNMDVQSHVTSIVRDGATWTYSYDMPSRSTSTLVVTDPLNRTRIYQSDLTVGLPTRVQDEYGRVTTYRYDANKRLASATTPGGTTTYYSYDSRGNVVRTQVTGEDGATLVTSATYQDLTCSTVGTCNRMVTSTDARGAVTTYGYDPTHAGVTSAVTQGTDGTETGVWTRYARVDNVWLPSEIWSCRTQASCDGTADAVKTTVSYDHQLRPVSITKGAGDGSLQATTAFTYTLAGDVQTEDGPLPGAVDATRHYYDAEREPLGTVGPDPDGDGPLPRRATRTD